MKIIVIGTGYVGLVTGVCFAEMGHEVTCIDVSEDKIRLLKDGVSTIYETGLETLLKRNLLHERLFFTTELKAALPGTQAIFLAVGTPQDEDGSADLNYVITAAQEVGAHLTGPATVVVKSTVPVGTCDQVEATVNGMLEQRGVSFRVTVASNPEFLQEGRAVENFLKPDRIIVGTNCEADVDLFRELYAPFTRDNPAKVIFMDRRSSELTKYAANAMLATRISFMNEISRLCEKVGANVDHIRFGMGADPRIGRKFLYAGPGYGGSCFPKDVSALIKTGSVYDQNLKVLEAVKTANHEQMQHVSNKILSVIKTMPEGKKAKIAVWGLAFKPGTDDIREAPALTIVQHLLDKGIEVIGHDPQAMGHFERHFAGAVGLSFAEDAYDAAKGADGIVVITEWREYRRPNWEKVSKLLREKRIFDLRNQYQGTELTSHGFAYYCVGRPDDSYPVLN